MKFQEEFKVTVKKVVNPFSQANSSNGVAQDQISMSSIHPVWMLDASETDMPKQHPVHGYAIEAMMTTLITSNNSHEDTSQMTNEYNIDN